MKLHRLIILTLCSFALISCSSAEEKQAAYLEKAKTSFDAGNLEEALIELENVIQLDPDDSNALFLQGRIYEQHKDYQKAFSYYLKVEGLDPKNLENQAKIGRFYLLLFNQPEKAQEKVDVILAENSSSSDGLLLKAAILLRDKKTSEALELTEAIVSREPGHVESVTFLATLFLKDGDVSKTIDVLDAALKENNNNETLNKLLAVVLLKNKDYDRAEQMFKSYLVRHPDNAESYNNLAIFYNEMGDKEKAETMLRDSIVNSPDDVNRKLTLIKYIIASKGNVAAINELNTQIDQAKDQGKLRIALAELHILNDDLENATKVFKQAINDFPSQVTGVNSRIGLASIYINNKDIDQAIIIINEAYDISPGDPKVNYLKAKVAIHQKDFEQAIISLRIVTKETPENIEAFLLLANIYKLQNNVEQAKDILNLAYENNKTNSKALLVLARYHASSDIVLTEKIIDVYNNLIGSDYEGLSIKAAILNKKKLFSEAKTIALKLMDTYPGKPNGYLQAIPELSQSNDLSAVISLLEKGYISTEDNRKILVLLTTFQVIDKQFTVVEKRIKAELNANPEDTELKLLLAKVYLADKDNDSAEKLLISVVDGKSSMEMPYLLLSEIYQLDKNVAAEVDVLIKGSENVADSIKIALRLATTYERSGQYVKAIEIYSEINKSKPENLIIVNNLASILSDYGNGKEDMQLAKKLIVQLEDSGQAIFLDTIGWVYYKDSDHQSAIEYLKQVVEKSPDTNVFNYHLGMAYKMSGDTIKARLYLEKSLEDNKLFKEKVLAESALKSL